MIVAEIFVCLIFGSAITSASIYGVETFADEEWWANGIFLKFYSPSGKNYFIHQRTGEISLESSDSLQEKAKDVYSTYITFVSLNLKIYDIYFEHQDLNYVPHIVERKVIYNDKSTFIRHTLHSFVGPNMQVYTVSFDNVSNISIEPDNPVIYLDHLQIKTLGPYSQWEHTYNFSKNGDSATDRTLSPVKKLAARSIPLLELDDGPLENLMVKYNTPSGKRYFITSDLNIASIRDQEDVRKANESYITFIEPNGKEYDMYFCNDIPNIVAVDNANEVEPGFGRPIVRLLSFVGPKGNSYRIAHMNENGEDKPVIDSSQTQSSEVQLTVLVTTQYYNRYIKFIFSDEGKELSDRVDEFDSTPLAQMHQLTTEKDEVEANSEVAKSSFLKYFSPSGRTYYLTPDETSGKFAVEKGIKNNAQSPYISFLLQDGRTSNIYYTPDNDPYMEINENDGNNSTVELFLVSFVTPDRKYYKMQWNVDNERRIQYIDTTPQPIDPIDQQQEETLKIVIGSTSRDFSYTFTWDGSKLVAVSARPRKRVQPGVLKSLIG